MKTHYYYILIAFTAALFACEPENPPQEEFSRYGPGVFIVNEGNYGSNNASLSFYSKDSLNITNEVYKRATGNDRLGDVFQSMTIIGKKAYLVINGNQKIEVLNLEDNSNARITGLSYPRYIEEAGEGKAYISNGNGYGQDYIYILNTKNDQITDSIAIATGPETFLRNGNDMYVACKGGYLSDSTVYVINTETNVITDTIQVGQVPAEMVKDAWGNIWVCCNGRNVYNADWSAIIKSIPGSLVKIDPVTNSVVKTIRFNLPLAGFGTNNLAINNIGTKIYINDGDIKEYDIETDVVSSIITAAFWYGIDVDPSTNNIWGSLSSGKVQVYNTDGNRLAEYEAGASPGGAIFYE